MRTIIVFILLITAVLVAGSLIAYPVYLLISPFTDLGFHKYVHYSILLTGLGLCIYYLKASNEMSDAYGLTYSKQVRLQTLTKSFFAGVLILLVIECLLFAFGMRTMDPRFAGGGIPGFLNVIFKGLVTGLFVGVLEETIYRGAIFRGLWKHSNTVIAVICSSFLYAGVHFIEFAEVTTGTIIRPLDGLAMLIHGFYMFSDPLIYDSFITLFMLGILFCLVRIKTGAIIACVGLHAGIVAMNKIMNYSTVYKTGSEFEFLINHYDKLNGWLASTCLIIACLIFFISPIKRSSR